MNEEKIGTVGLSLGGETVMYVAALDERIKIAVSSGWLTTRVFGAEGRCALDVHDGGHIFHGGLAFEWIERYL